MKKIAPPQNQTLKQTGTPTPKPRHVLSIERNAQESNDEASARVLIRPTTQAASVIQKLQGDNQEINALVKELQNQVAMVAKGDLGRAEAMLVAQAHTLDEIFAALARRSAANIGAGYGEAAERYMRLALKAQSQCRTTLETLAEIKNPRPVAFVRQANIAAGAQQVNNGGSSPLQLDDNLCGKSRAGNPENAPIKLLEALRDGERLDITETCATGASDKAMEALGEIDRAKNAEGKVKGREECL